MSMMRVSGFSGRPTRSRSFLASALVRFQSTTPPEARSLPMKMFSAIDRKGLSASSWWMITMPSASESLIVRYRHSLPSKVMVPE